MIHIFPKYVRLQGIIHHLLLGSLQELHICLYFLDSIVKLHERILHELRKPSTLVIRHACAHTPSKTLEYIWHPCYMNMTGKTSTKSNLALKLSQNMHQKQHLILVQLLGTDAD